MQFSEQNNHLQSKEVHFNAHFQTNRLQATSAPEKRRKKPPNLELFQYLSGLTRKTERTFLFHTRHIYSVRALRRSRTRREHKWRALVSKATGSWQQCTAAFLPVAVPHSAFSFSHSNSLGKSKLVASHPLFSLFWSEPARAAPTAGYIFSARALFFFSGGSSSALARSDANSATGAEKINRLF